MKIFVREAALAAVLGFGACSKPAPKAPEPAPKSRLQEVVEGLNTAPPCSNGIPFEWSPSWPVPILNNGKLEYRAFFFGREGKLATGFRFHQAEGDVVFTPEGKIGECRRRALAGTVIPADRRSTASLQDTLEKSRRLYASTEEIAALYASGRVPLGDDRKKIAAFSSAFDELADPSHAADYRALSPGFWIWIEKNGGTPLPSRKKG